MRGSPQNFKWSAKHKKSICNVFRGPLVVRGADFGNHCYKELKKLTNVVLSIKIIEDFNFDFKNSVLAKLEEHHRIVIWNNTET